MDQNIKENPTKIHFTEFDRLALSQICKHHALMDHKKTKGNLQMPTKNQIQKILTQVIDPELGKNIVEAGMVRDIQIEGGQVNITLALTMKGCPLKDQLQTQTKEAAEAVPGVESVTVQLTTMTQEEREKLQKRLPQGLNMNRIGQMVAVLSGKGGVGKSSVTALLASAAATPGVKCGCARC